MIQISYSQARQNLANLLSQVEDNNDIAIITRRGYKDIALIPADELSSILETLHLLSSPKNAQRLYEALEEADQGGGREMTIDALRKEFSPDE
jgi:antitoxin YefM